MAQETNTSDSEELDVPDWLRKPRTRAVSAADRINNPDNLTPRRPETRSRMRLTKFGKEVLTFTAIAATLAAALVADRLADNYDKSAATPVGKSVTIPVTSEGGDAAVKQAIEELEAQTGETPANTTWLGGLLDTNIADVYTDANNLMPTDANGYVQSGSVTLQMTEGAITQAPLIRVIPPASEQKKTQGSTPSSTESYPPALPLTGPATDPPKSNH